MLMPLGSMRMAIHNDTILSAIDLHRTKHKNAYRLCEHVE